MKKEFKTENIRFLDSVNYIDDRFISEVLADVKVPKDPADDVKPRRAWKQIAVFAACMVLLGALIPVITYLIPRITTVFEGNAGAGTSSEANALPEHDVYLLPYHTRVLIRYNTETGEYTELIKGVISYIIYDGKIYYFRSVNDEETFSRYFISCYDPETGESIDLCDFSAYPYSHLVGSDGFIYFSTRNTAYRIPASGGEAETLFEFEGEEAVYAVIDRKVISVNLYATTISSSTPKKSTIMSFDLDTGEKKMIWSAEGTEYGMLWDISNINGILYLNASKSGTYGKSLLTLDIETREITTVLENLSSYFISSNGIYYYLHEPRIINWRSMFSSNTSDYGTSDSAELYRCDLNGKNSEVVFTNSDFACLTYTIADGKMIGSFCGDFTDLGWKRAYLIVSIDLSTGKLTLIDKPKYSNFDSEQIN